MYAPAVRLEAAGLDPLVFNGPEGIELLALDLGDAATREVVNEYPDANGTIDTTAYVGARVISLQVFIDQPTWKRRTRLRSFTSLRVRPTLITKLAADAPEVQIACRRSAYSDPMSTDDVFADQLFATVQFVAPSGVFEANVPSRAVVSASGIGTELGRAYDLTFDRTYPASPIIGTAVALNNGTETAYPVIRIYGPCTNPVISNVTASLTMSFTGLTIAVGEFLEIDTRAKTIRYLGNANDSRYQTLVFPGSTWLALSPGSNLLRFVPATSSPPSNAEFTWRDAYL